jgi:hypothetical protein
MNEVNSVTPVCEVCGRQLRSINRIGICTVNLECLRERDKRAHEGKRVRPTGRQKCKHPDGCSHYALSHGWCSMHWQRMGRKEGDPGPVGPLKSPAPLISAGGTFGSWVALEAGGGPGGTVIPCRCECGNVRLISAYGLVAQTGKPCHCRNGRGKPPGRPMKRRWGKPYIPAGATFGRLTVLEDAWYSNDKIRCACECGGEKNLKATSLKNAHTRSCGCVTRENRVTHGLSRHPLYCTWRSMVERCTKPGTQAYADYGGRGIGVFEGWIGTPDGLIAFIEYIERELGPRPEGLSLDRTDNDGDYEPGNVRWATTQQQMINRRSIAKLTRERDALLIILAERDAEIAELKAERAMLRAPLPARKRAAHPGPAVRALF